MGSEIKVYCNPINCKKAKECERYIGNHICTTNYLEDYSTMGSCTMNSENKLEIIYYCGDNGNYNKFIKNKYY